jgi:phosphate starvation-inducible protein PhoH and related proteins
MPAEKRANRYKDKEAVAKTKEAKVKIEAKTETQRAYLKSLIDMEFDTVGIGPAGTGKTYMAAMVAAQKYSNGSVDQIVLIRPNISHSQTLGLLPGEIEDKLEQWIAPFKEVIISAIGQGAWDTGRKNNKIQCVALEFIQGRTFNNAYILVDEAENCTQTEMFYLLTRIGYKSKIVLSGDLRQSALKCKNGLEFLVDQCEKDVPYDVIEFTIEDVVRSGKCKQYIRLFND